MSLLRKFPECDQCQFNARSHYIVCAVHPQGPKEDSCLDFRLDNSIQTEPSWAPNEYDFYNGELTRSISDLTQGDRLKLLDSHPLFTGRCPKCDRVFIETPQIHWDCDECGWKDDSV